MRKLKQSVLVLLVVLAAAALLGAGDGSYQVIVNPSNPVDSLSARYVKDLFLGRVKSWDHGGKVAPVDLGAESGARQAFSKSVLGKSMNAVRSYWQQRIFSGRGVPPPELGSEREVVSFVRRTPGAIGYVSSSASVGGVKTIEIRR